GQDADGRFHERLIAAKDGGGGDLRSPLSRELMYDGFRTQIVGMRALTRAHDDSQMLVLRIRIETAWVYLNRMWKDWAVSGESLPPSVLWELLTLWDETQPSVRPGAINHGIDWSQWDTRFTELRRQLSAQLDSDQGPAPLPYPAP